MSKLFEWKHIRKSLVIAALVGLPLSLFGFAFSMGLAHSGGLLLLLFLPTWPVFVFFGSGGPFAGAPEWLFIALATLAEFAGVFMVVHLVRMFIAKSQSDA